MVNKILVPLDGSKRAEAVLSHVEDLALNCGREVILMRVVEPVYIQGRHGADMSTYERMLDQNLQEAEDYLSGLEGEFRQKGIETHTHVVYGPVVEQILAIAETQEVDLIALASHGRSGLSQVFYGSVAVGVLHRADRPLFIVRSV